MLRRCVVLALWVFAVGAGCTSPEERARQEALTDCRAYAAEALSCAQSMAGPGAEQLAQVTLAKSMEARVASASPAELPQLRKQCVDGITTFKKVCS